MKYYFSKFGLYYFILAFSFSFLTSCSKDETIHIATADSLKVQPGKYRVKLSWKVNDNAVNKAVIYWIKDSAIVPYKGYSERMSVILSGLDEGDCSFNIYLYDKAGHRSAPSNINTHIYGNNYEQSLSNRTVKDVLFYDGKTKISWGEPPKFSVGIEVSYTDSEGSNKLITASDFVSQTVLMHYKKGTSFEYRTKYLPQSNAIDTFYFFYKRYVDVKSISFITQRILNNTTLIGTFYNDSTINISSGLQETDIFYANHSDLPKHVFILKVELLIRA